MSSSPNTPLAGTPTNNEMHQVIQAYLQNHTDAFKTELKTISQRHVVMNLGVIAVLALILITGLLAGRHALNSFDSQLAKADTRYEQYVTDNKALKARLDASDNKIQFLADQQAKQQKSIDKRDTTTNKKIDDVKSPDKTNQQAADDLVSAYGSEPFVNWNILDQLGHFSFSKPQVQMFTVTKLDRDRLFADYAERGKQLDEEKQKTADLADDKKRLKKSNDQADASLQQYKSLAEKSKFRKFLDGAEKVGIFIGGVYLGKKL